jgi:putative glutamine amidotransferase
VNGSASSVRPVIGVSTLREQARWGVWDTQADLLPSTYARAIETAGGAPVLLPAQRSGAGAIGGRLDGLVIAGGADVNPARYAAEPHERTAGWRDDRDDWEFALLDAAADLNLPTLGVCRGMQVMAAHAGGRLDQHTPDLVGHDRHSPGRDEYGTIAVRTQSQSLLRRLVGDHLQVSCHHHQSVRTHPGYEVAARADDGTIEAMEDPRRPFWVGVQWHPETLDDLGLFQGLIAAARAARA